VIAGGDETGCAESARPVRRQGGVTAAGRRRAGTGVYAPGQGLHMNADEMIIKHLENYLYYAQTGFDGFALCDDYAFNANPFFRRRSSASS